MCGSISGESSLIGATLILVAAQKHGSFTGTAQPTPLCLLLPKLELSFYCGGAIMSNLDSTQWIIRNIQPVTITVQPMSLPHPATLPVSIYNTKSLKLYSYSAKYKFSRANWYRARYSWLDYTDVMAWCDEHFGARPKRPDAWSRWQIGPHGPQSGQILFRDEEDFVLYTLRWGNGA